MILSIKKLESGYGKKQILFGVSLEVDDAEFVALIGPNGAGKSTLLKVVSGVLQPWTGKLKYRGKFRRFGSPADSVAAGIGFSPQGNRVFTELTVKENLEVGGFTLGTRLVAERTGEVLELFPRLRERIRMQAGKLSGGEQQMLALARALMMRPKLLLLDEPSLGLSPQLISRAFKQIADIRQDFGTAMLVVEQKVRKILAISDRVYSLKLGEVSFEGQPMELQRNGEKLRELFL